MLSSCRPVGLVGQSLSNREFRWEFVPAIWAAIRVLKPLLDALVAENMLTFWKTNGVLSYAFRITDAEFVVADDAC